MKMPIRLQNNVPEVYVNESRDFQLLCRLYDCIINGVKFDIDSMKFLTDTRNCNSRVLDLLKTKLGFFNDKYIFNEDMRSILQAFPYIIKYKGSKEGILRTVNLFLKINKMNSESTVDINEKDYPNVIRIGVESPLKNITILDEILKYIVPTGYTIDYYFYKNAESGQTEVSAVTDLKIIKIYDGNVFMKSNKGGGGNELNSEKESQLAGEIPLTEEKYNYYRSNIGTTNVIE